MLELTCENVLDYLRQKGWLEPGPARAESLGGGVSNQVLRIIGPHRFFVLKQSRPQLRTRDAWFSDLDRIWREQEVMQALLPLLPTGTVPEVLFVDRENFAYGMSHSPPESRVWKEMLLSGDGVSAGLAAHAGTVLGMIHEKTARRPDLMEPFRDHTVYVQLRVDPFYRRIQERRPEVAHVVAGIIDEMLSRQEALCHGDYTPKNMLVHPAPSHRPLSSAGEWGRGERAGFMLVDYETAHFGDPTMDLGLFLTHILLKSCRCAEKQAEFFGLARAFWRGYVCQVSFRPGQELEARGLRHLGVCLLARVDGTSPVDYLPEPQRDAVRRLGRRILLDNVTTWDDVLSVSKSPV